MSRDNTSLFLHSTSWLNLFSLTLHHLLSTTHLITRYNSQLLFFFFLTFSFIFCAFWNHKVAMVTSSYYWIIWLQTETEFCTFLVWSYKYIKFSLSLSVSLFGLISFLIKDSRTKLEVTLLFLVLFYFSSVIQVPIFPLWLQIQANAQMSTSHMGLIWLISKVTSLLCVSTQEFYLAALLDPQ